MKLLLRFAPLAAAISLGSVIAVISGCAPGISAPSIAQPSTGALSTTATSGPNNTSQPTGLSEVALVAIAPSPVIGGTQANGTVTLNGPSSSGDIVISLKSDTPLAVQVVDSLTIPKGSTTASFVVNTSPVQKDASVYVYGSRLDAAGAGTQRRALIVVRAPELKSITIPSRLASGQTFTGTVTISGPAPSPGFVITLRQQPGGYLSYPQTVTVEPGKDSADFQGTVGVVPSQRSGQIVAEGGGGVIPANTTLVP